MPVVPQNSPLVQFVALNSPTVEFIALNRPMVQFIAFNSPVVHGLIVTLNSAMVQIVALNSPMMQFVALNSPIVQFVALNSPTVQFVPLNNPMMQFDTTLTQFHADTQNDQYPVKAVFVFPAMTLACIAVYVKLNGALFGCLERHAVKMYFHYEWKRWTFKKPYSCFFNVVVFRG